MESFIDLISKENHDANIIHINYNDDVYENLMEYHALVDYVKINYRNGVNNYLFIDEVQMCEGFEKAINSLHSSEKYDIYITGSNAFY